MKNDLIEECYQKSIELLLNNSTRHGVLASSPSKRAKERFYLSIFGRDASICSLGMVASGNKKLITSAKNSLLTLACHQAENGQIPNFVKLKPQKEANFWKNGCIDSTLWWLISLDFYNRYSGDKKIFKKLSKNIKNAIQWLLCQEHVKDRLVMQNESSDWADIMPRSGKVLYSNALWYYVKRLYKIDNRQKTKDRFNSIFHPTKKDLNSLPNYVQHIIKKQEKKLLELKYYLSFNNYYFFGYNADVFGNSLAIIFDLPNKKFKSDIVNYLLKTQNKKYPIPALFHPIKVNSKYWRDYMMVYNQNLPYQYHNGGIWPFVSCFFVVALGKIGKRKIAHEELERVAEANKRGTSTGSAQGNWQFNEWQHGKTGKSMGMHNQSWNAGMFIFTYHYLKGDIKI